MDAIRQSIRDYVASTFLDEQSAAELTDSSPLISGGALDSINTLKLVLFLEETFSIDVEAHEIGVTHLDSIAAIAELVRGKRPAAA